MALRVLLVGLVASMGLALPSGQDVKSWADSGGRWVESRLADLNHFRAEAERAFEGGPATDPAVYAEATAPARTEVATTRDDLTFDAVVEGMASSFAADLATIEKAKSGVEIAATTPAPTLEEVPADTCIAPDALVAEGDSLDLENPEASPTPVLAVESPSTAEKLTSAVRLTKEAVNAWASV